MTTATVFVSTADMKPRAALAGEAEPTVVVVLRTWLQLSIAFVTNGAVVALADNTPVTLTLKPPATHTGPAFGLDLTADISGAGATTRYALKALIDSEALRTWIGTADSKELTAQVSWGTEDTESFCLSLPFTVTVVNAIARDNDAAPDPLSNAYWTKLKASIPASDSVTHNDNTKTISVEGGGGAWGEIGGTLPDQTDLQAALDAKVNATWIDMFGPAPLNSPALTGEPTAPTPIDPSTSTDQLATTAFVHAVKDALLNAAPAQLDTLKELAEALGDDPNFAATITAALAARLQVSNNLSDLDNAATALSNLGFNITPSGNLKLTVSGTDYYFLAASSEP